MIIVNESKRNRFLVFHYSVCFLIVASRIHITIFVIRIVCKTQKRSEERKKKKKKKTCHQMSMTTEFIVLSGSIYFSFEKMNRFDYCKSTQSDWLLISSLCTNSALSSISAGACDVFLSIFSLLCFDSLIIRFLRSLWQTNRCLTAKELCPNEFFLICTQCMCRWIEFQKMSDREQCFDWFLVRGERTRYKKVFV